MVTSAELDANRPVRRMRRVIGCLLAVVVFMTVTAVFGLPKPASAVVLNKVPDAGTVQPTNGRVTSILQVGDTIYLGGSFTQVNVGGTLVSRTRLAAIDATTGALLPWTPKISNNSVLALAASPDGSRIYVGGSFTSVRGQGQTLNYREHLVAFHAYGTTDAGRIVSGWEDGGNAEPSLPVYSLATRDNLVYFGGHFTSVDGVSRQHLAAVDGVTGALNPNWTPTTDGNVRTLVFSPDKTLLYVGGNYGLISGQARPNLAVVDPVSGAVGSWTPKPSIANDYEVFDLEVTDTRVHVAGGGRSPDGTAESFDAVTGASMWHYYSSGDFQAVALLDGKLYFGGHFINLYTDNWAARELLARRNKLMAVDADSGTLDLSWKPSADKGIWAMTPDTLRGRVYAGGDFTQINRQPPARFAQFSSAM